MGEIHRFLSFYVKISQNWLKFLGCPQNFWRITLKNKNLFIRPKNCVQIILYNERCKEFRKNQFFSVICQNFQDNLRILANFGKFSRKNSKIYGFRPYVFKKLQFFLVFFQ